MCGIVQLVVTLVMLEINESMKSGENHYGQLMAMFGATLMTAAVSIFFNLFKKKNYDAKNFGNQFSTFQIFSI